MRQMGVVEILFQESAERELKESITHPLFIADASFTDFTARKRNNLILFNHFEIARRTYNNRSSVTD